MRTDIGQSIWRHREQAFPGIRSRDFTQRRKETIEVAAYYVVSEALANVAKHACASGVHVAVEAREGILRVAVRDDGLGGADPALGSGLLGLKDRAEAIGGRISLESPPGAGTSLLVELPVDDGNQ